MIKVAAKLHFSLETGAAVSFKSGQLFQRAEKKFAETYFLKIVLSPHLRAWLACLADQTPIWSFRRFTYWDFLLIIYFCDKSIFICNVCAFEVGSDWHTLEEKKGWKVVVFLILARNNVFTGPRCLWGPVYGSRCLYVPPYNRFVKLCWCDSGWWWYQLNTIDDANLKRSLTIRNQCHICKSH